MHPFIYFLEDRLTRPLPGWKAQIIMAPRPKPEGLPIPSRHKMPLQPENVKKGAALAPLTLDPDGRLNVILTLRSEKLNSHRGQISFPGGRIDPNETQLQAALREAQEEICLQANCVKVLGKLTELYIPPTNNFVTPFLGYVEQLPPLLPNPDEVAEIIFVPLQEFTRPEKIKTTIKTIRDREEEVPYWDVHATTPLWGATAMMISELAHLYQEFEDL